MTLLFGGARGREGEDLLSSQRSFEVGVDHYFKEDKTTMRKTPFESPLSLSWLRVKQKKLKDATSMSWF